MNDFQILSKWQTLYYVRNLSVFYMITKTAEKEITVIKYAINQLVLFQLYFEVYKILLIIQVETVWYKNAMNY